MIGRLALATGGLLALAGAAVMWDATVTFEDEPSPRPLGFASRPGPFAPAAASVGNGALAVPVQGYARSALLDSWGDPRGGGERGHRGIDLMAAEGTPVVAAADGVVEKLFESDLGGTTLYLRSRDGRSQYYYAHLAGYAQGVREGLRVRAGQVLGYVGDTGDAGEGNHHLHFSVARMEPGDRWHQGEDVNPYPLLADRPGRR